MTHGRFFCLFVHSVLLSLIVCLFLCVFNNNKVAAPPSPSPPLLLLTTSSTIRSKTNDSIIEVDAVSVCVCVSTHEHTHSHREKEKGQVTGAPEVYFGTIRALSRLLGRLCLLPSFDTG